MTGDVYISTACQHGKHEQCREQCKFCPALCACIGKDCQHAAASDIEDCRHWEADA